MQSVVCWSGVCLCVCVCARINTLREYVCDSIVRHHNTNTMLDIFCMDISWVWLRLNSNNNHQHQQREREKKMNEQVLLFSLSVATVRLAGYLVWFGFVWHKTGFSFLLFVFSFSICRCVMLISLSHQKQKHRVFWWSMSS